MVRKAVTGRNPDSSVTSLVLTIIDRTNFKSGRLIEHLSSMFRALGSNKNTRQRGDSGLSIFLYPLAFTVSDHMGRSRGD